MKTIGLGHALQALYVLLLISGTGGVALADGIQPIQILVRELPSGEYDVQWSIPQSIPQHAIPIPRLPAGSRPTGERISLDRPGKWLTRQTFECPSGVSGQPIGIDFPAHNIGVSTLIKVELLSGERFAHVLNPGEETWTVPVRVGGDLEVRLRGARNLLARGVQHFATGPVHIGLLLIVCLLGDLRQRLRLATTFFVGQIVGVGLSTWTAAALAGSVSESGLALAVVLLARETLRDPDERRQLVTLTAVAGIVHGLGVGNWTVLPGTGIERGLETGLLFALGIDASLVTGIVAAAGLGALFARRGASRRLARVASYAIAVSAMAMAVGFAFEAPTESRGNSKQQLQLPSLAAAPGSAMPSGSRRLAALGSGSTIQSFLAVEAFEIRHEILIRASDLVDDPAPQAGSVIDVADQAAVKSRAERLVLDHSSLSIDGEYPTPTAQRVDFMLVDDRGALPRTVPVPEDTGRAWVGVTLVYFVKTVARKVVLDWGLPGTDWVVPATVTDPETSQPSALAPGQSALVWTNGLSEEPAPRISAVEVEPVRLELPIWSLLPLLGALVALMFGIRRRHPVPALSLARVLLALAVLVGPWGTVALALPGFGDSTPREVEAQRILARIFPNVYRALEFRDEAAVFDRLALSVTGESLTDAYLENRRMLEMAERGGARVRIEAVEVLSVEDVDAIGSGGFVATSTWTIGGTVTHFGHRHFRLNRYRARVEVLPDGGFWKLGPVDLMDEERLR